MQVEKCRSCNKNLYNFISQECCRRHTAFVGVCPESEFSCSVVLDYQEDVHWIGCVSTREGLRGCLLELLLCKDFNNTSSEAEVRQVISTACLLCKLCKN